MLDWGAVDQALRLLDEAPIQLDKANAKNLIVNRGQIVFDKVKFDYHGSYSLFQNKSVVIEVGQKVGLVGFLEGANRPL